jgi:hypothetical protein
VDLSSLANALLLQHRADYSDTTGYTDAFRRVPGYTDDETAAAYAELAGAGLMEAGAAVKLGGVDRHKYRLTGTSRDTAATLGEAPAAAGDG